MKRYVPIVIGVIALCAVLYVGNDQMKKDGAVALEETTTTALTTFSGKVVRTFEGDNILEYGFDLPETATTSVEQDGALVKVTDADAPVLAMYFSFNGGRGYSPEDYIINTIAPKVQAVTVVGTATVGAHEWTVAESEWSVWHVAKSDNGQWLIVVENKKTDAEKANALIGSIVTK
jgi:hypothetical protein